MMRRAPALILFFYAAFLAWVTVAAAWETLHRFWTSDDGFFYLAIARNIARGHGSTFDGLSVTNGYQPLWLVMLTALYRATGPLSPEAGARAAMAVSGVCAVGGIALLARLLRRLSAPPIVVAGGTVALLGAVGFSFFGLEAHLSVVMTGVVFAGVWRRWQSAPRDGSAPQGRALLNAAALGLAAGLLVLTRLDLAAWIGVLLPALALGRRRSGWSWLQAARAFSVECGVAAAIIAGYFVVNRALFGMWLPISASLRTKPPGIHWETLAPAAWIDYPVGAIMIGLPVMMLVVVGRAIRSKGWNAVASAAPGFGGALAAGVLAHTFATALFAVAVEWRYLVTSSCALVVIGAILIAELLASLPARHAATTRRIIATGTGVAVLMLAVLSSRRAITPSGSFERSDLTRFSQALPGFVTRDSVAFAVDLSGEPGWFCDCHLINGDGVVNDWKFQTFVRERRITDYLDAKQAAFVIVKAAQPHGDRVWLNGWDWRSFDAPEFPVASYPVSAALLNVGRFYLFRRAEGVPP